MSTPRAVVILAEGAEEMEVVILVDVLRRGGVAVTLAGLDGAGAVRCSRGVTIVPDVALTDAPDDPELLVLPGGAGGAERLAASAAVGTWLRAQESSGRLVAAVCAGPIALVAHGVFVGRDRTAHPSVASRAEVSEVRGLVRDGALFTGNGPGACFELALVLVEALMGRERAASVRAPMMLV
jgi:protein DJ-1